MIGKPSIVVQVIGKFSLANSLAQDCNQSMPVLAALTVSLIASQIYLAR